MSTHHSKGWEPDPQKTGNWRAMFEQPRRDGQPPGPAAAPAAGSRPDDVGLDDEAPDIDLKEYRPWILQRGRSRPAMMLELRRFEPRSGLWQSWAMAYPSLYAVECLGDRMLSLDFGSRQFVIEGRGRDELARHLRRGVVTMIVEYTSSGWGSATGDRVEHISPVPGKT